MRAAIHSFFSGCFRRQSWCSLLGGLLAASSLSAAPAKILKVLPHYLDREGRQALSPSLYERDAYQAHLRRSPDQRGGLRFKVQWKADPRPQAHLRLRLELLTARGNHNQTTVLETAVQAKSAWRRWSAITLRGDAFRQAGELIAWRATLWDTDQLLAEQRSFLW